jgi:WhiB family redox-sensing transcriptional regulator
MDDWQSQALCAQTDPEAFYPEKGESARPAKRVCRACPVRPACLEEALSRHEQWGVWGGMSAREPRNASTPGPRGAAAPAGWMPCGPSCWT